MREGLLAYVEQMRQDARDEHWQAMQLYATGNFGKKPPRVPEILK